MQSPEDSLSCSSGVETPGELNGYNLRERELERREMPWEKFPLSAVSLPSSMQQRPEQLMHVKEIHEDVEAEHSKRLEGTVPGAHTG